MPMLLAAMHFEKNWFSGNSRMGTREFGRETRIWGRGIAESDNGRLHQTCLPKQLSPGLDYQWTSEVPGERSPHSFSFFL
jgi:hypothetical protein